uniref:Uncharacterized protein n=1 Tax=Rhipicephalus zambeziensis TaxID=60191 RepID=A0A224YGF6_9ACAR
MRAQCGTVSNNDPLIVTDLELHLEHFRPDWSMDKDLDLQNFRVYIRQCRCAPVVAVFCHFAQVTNRAHTRKTKKAFLDHHTAHFGLLLFLLPFPNCHVNSCCVPYFVCSVIVQ